MIPEKWKKFFPETIDIDENTIPKKSDIFRAFELIDPENVKVVILGQDPYPNIEHATGVAFSVPDIIKKLPPSLKNIIKNLEKFGHPVPKNGNLEYWSTDYGVLLMNCSLTLGHEKMWNPIMKKVIKKLSDEYNPKFILLGAFAIDQYSGNNFIASSHPSPLSATKKCRNYNPFTETNVFAGIFPLKSE